MCVNKYGYDSAFIGIHAGIRAYSHIDMRACLGMYMHVCMDIYILFIIFFSLTIKIEDKFYLYLIYKKIMTKTKYKILFVDQYC